VSEIWVAGEALIDLVPDSTGLINPIVGGGPANTAKALAQLGLTTTFIGGISTDDFGGLIWGELEQSDVVLSKVKRSALPTATAMVSLSDSGSASYQFKLGGTATFEFNEEWLPTGSPSVLLLGSLASLIQPGASSLFAWAQNLNAPILFDPNVRPSVNDDQVSYRESVERWLRISEVVKLSEEDISWLFGHTDPSKLLDYGPSLVVMTRGEKGIVGVTKDLEVSVNAERVNVVDTVGAGDTVGAILAEAMASRGLTGLMENLEVVLERAAKASAITCSRAGAKPPTLQELDDF
jgi:fructokinase